LLIGIGRHPWGRLDPKAAKRTAVAAVRVCKSSGEIAVYVGCQPLSMLVDRARRVLKTG